MEVPKEFEEVKGAKEMFAAVERFGRFSTEFHKESDRGCAVLVLCLLEEGLQEMIRALLPDPNAKLGRLAPPGGVGAALETAELLGLLSKRQARSFKMLADVRNRFAHAVMEDLSFDSQEIANLLKSVPPAIPYPPELAGQRTNRTAFLTEAGLLWMLMLMKTPQIERLPRPVDFDAVTGFASIAGLPKKGRPPKT